MNAFLSHLKEQEHYYGKQFLISLVGSDFTYLCHPKNLFSSIDFQINHHGAEGRLNEKYRELAEANRGAYLK